MRKRSNLTLYIFIAMNFGAVVGYYVYAQYSIDTRSNFSTNIKLLSTIFLRLVQMIIAPLVFSTLVVGIAKLGSIKTVGRVGGKAIRFCDMFRTSTNVLGNALATSVVSKWEKALD